MPTGAGQRDERVSLQALDPEARDAHGQPVEGDEGWSEVAAFWVRVNPKGGRESVSSAHFQYPSTTVFRALAREGVTTDLSLVWNGQRYTIDDVVKVGNRGEEIDIIGHRMQAETIDGAGQ